MRPLLTTAHYSSAEWFETESHAIFKRLWILAAIKPMLVKHLDYRTVTIAGIPLVLQNNAGVIRAFANICRHRMARIQNQEFGNRPLVCPYHHWCYDGEGKLQHAHKDPSIFGFSAEGKAGIRLHEFKTAIIGNLVFINLDDNPMPIEEQFDAETIALLESSTAHMDSSFVYTRYECAFNWKTGIENIKDGLHVQCLHKASFPEYFDIGVSGSVPGSSEPTNLARQISLSQATTTGDVVMQDPPKLEWHALVKQLDSKGHYRSIHLFPNVNLMIVDGTSFAIQIYNPLAADKTEMQMMVALTSPINDFPHKPVVLWEHLVSDMKVLKEDIDCLEALQANFAAATSEIIHGAYESAILDFQAAYLTQLDRHEQHKQGIPGL